MGASQLSLLFTLLLLALLSACSRDKQVPFGLEDPTVAESPSETAEEPTEPGEPTKRPAAEVFEPGKLEIPVGKTAMVLDSGYALAALRVDLNHDGTPDLLAVSADSLHVRLHAAREQDLGSDQTQIDAFLVPAHCVDPRAQIEQLSPSLAAVRVQHRCASGTRTNCSLVTLEAQPRLRERITVLEPNPRSTAPMDLTLRAVDVDADGYEDVLADVTVSGLQIPLTWLNRPGGFARDSSQPEAGLQQAADAALEQLGHDVAAASETANQVLQAYAAICRESGAARIGLSGTQGIQCGGSAATAQAAHVAIETAILERRFVDALGLQRQWSSLDEADAPRVRAAWRDARSAAGTRWRSLLSDPGPVSLHFEDEDHLVVRAGTSRRIQLSSGTSSIVESPMELPPIVDPSGKFAVTGLRRSCQGIEAELRPIGGRKSSFVPIAAARREQDCATSGARPLSLYDWQIVGWAPQGLVAAKSDRLRIVPVNALGKPAGPTSDLDPNIPLPAPIRGPSVSRDGSRYAIASREGILVRQWGPGRHDLWIRPAQWDAVPGELRAIALSPSGHRLALQKGSSIQLVEW